MIVAALAIVVHATNVASQPPGTLKPTYKYVYASAVDPRNGRVRPPFCDPNVYVFNTTGVHIFDLPVTLLEESWDGGAGRDDHVLVFWKVARRVKESYDELKAKKGLISNGHLWLSKFVDLAKQQKYDCVQCDTNIDFDVRFFCVRRPTSDSDQENPIPKPQTCPVSRLMC